ncbi:hypothetical protein QYE76_016447 [Lolium multiflorum]|uniref:Dof zinc finger protein n=1 Tax=Lolium multiflorum TaxID=4521 RepID=A0AAD8PS12_LOLMU|nr:hypothetical protein QYE76_016447 [Lolium multiflorum]
MAPASASLLPSSTTNAGTKRPAPAAVSDVEAPLLPQDGVAAGKDSQGQQQQQLECPRCKSRNTKFCYYNNYSTTQPRHFCRACRRYWTHGGTLRNVPVGGACRRSGTGNNKRRRSAEPSPSYGSPAEDAYRTDQLPATPFFPFLSDGAVFLPQFDLGLGGYAAAPTGFPWPAAAGPDHYDGLVTPWDGANGTLDGGAWDDFATGLELF